MLPNWITTVGTAALIRGLKSVNGSARPVPERERPAEQAESRPLAPTVLRASAVDLTAALSEVADQSGGDVEAHEHGNGTLHLIARVTRERLPAAPCATSGSRRRARQGTIAVGSPSAAPSMRRRCRGRGRQRTTTDAHPTPLSRVSFPRHVIHEEAARDHERPDLPLQCGFGL